MRECERCDGTGRIYPEDGTRPEGCSECMGTGEVETPAEADWLEWRAALVGRLSAAVEYSGCLEGPGHNGHAHATEAPGYDPASPGPVALLCDVAMPEGRRVFRVIVAEGMGDDATE